MKMPDPSARPHYAGHRKRLKKRFLENDSETLPDYEILELLLMLSIPRRDVKPLAKKLLTRFGSLNGVLSASVAALMEVEGIGENTAIAVRLSREIGRRMLREEARESPLISGHDALRDYCRLTLGAEETECFHLLFLDSGNRLLADERQQSGTVNHTPLYPREILKRALQLNAAALILVHNHPGGTARPSQDDRRMTRKVCEAAEPLGVRVHDHLIVTRNAVFSFRDAGLL